MPQVLSYAVESLSAARSCHDTSLHAFLSPQGVSNSSSRASSAGSSPLQRSLSTYPAACGGSFSLPKYLCRDALRAARSTEGIRRLHAAVPALFAAPGCDKPPLLAHLQPAAKLRSFFHAASALIHFIFDSETPLSTLFTVIPERAVRLLRWRSLIMHQSLSLFGQWFGHEALPKRMIIAPEAVAVVTTWIALKQCSSAAFYGTSLNAFLEVYRPYCCALQYFGVGNARQIESEILTHLRLGAPTVADVTWALVDNYEAATHEQLSPQTVTSLTQALLEAVQSTELLLSMTALDAATVLLRRAFNLQE